MKKHLLNISGMNGQHCVRLITHFVNQLEGVSVEQAEVGKALVSIDEQKTSRNAVILAIETLGYKVQH